jgi:nucleoside phosphorylase
MMDLVLDRITARASWDRFVPIQWPEHAPTKASYDPSQLPEADVIAWTYTRAEGEAMAKVLSPGQSLDDWIPYTTGFEGYEHELTDRSPAREAKCLGQWTLVEIAGKRVLLFRNELHLATDAKSLPLRRFWGQLITAVKPKLLIDTGTSGGIGSSIVEGDCIVGGLLRFDCQKTFADEPWAKEWFPCTYDTSGIDFSVAEGLMKANAGLLRPEATRDPVVVRGDVLTTDFFAEDTSSDYYGLRTYDPTARAVEMDASVLGLVARDLGSAMPPYTSIRSASDPQMTKGDIEEENRESSKVYERYGGAAQVETLCAVWQVIADLP